MYLQPRQRRGAADSSNVAISPAVALNLVRSDTRAWLDYLSTSALVSAADVDVIATHDGAISADTVANADGADVNVGVSVAINIIDDQVLANVDGDLAASGNSTIFASANAPRTATATSDAQGTATPLESPEGVWESVSNAAESMGDTLGELGDFNFANLLGIISLASIQNIASDSTSAFALAAAAALNFGQSTVEATIADGSSVSSGGDVDVEAHNRSELTAEADGLATLADSATSAAGAVNFTTYTTLARIGDGAMVAGDNLSVLAEARDGADLDIVGKAYGGAGGDNGNAGSLVLNNIDSAAAAEVGASASLAATQATLDLSEFPFGLRQ